MKLNRILAFTVVLCLIFLSLSVIVFLKDSELKADAQASASEDTAKKDIDATAAHNTVPEGMVRVAENDYLELYIDKATTAVAVKDKISGVIWHTNPEGREHDPIAAGHARNLMNSQISISYHIFAGPPRFMNNYFDSIKHGQFEITEIENGIRITYKIGRDERIFVVPTVISMQRMEQKILNNIPEDKRTILLRSYRLIVLEEIDDETRRARFLEQHPSLEEHDLYLLSAGIPSFLKEQLEEIVLASGYTIDDMNEDNRINNVPVREPRRDVFTIPLEYILDGKNLVVRIPTEEIVYHKEFPLHSIRVLEFFGAADTKQNGYMLVPDASGALINLNNNKQHFQPFSTQVYGRDHSIPLDRLTEISEQAYLPVFGLAKENKAFFAIIEKGEALATIRADVSRRINSYNSVFSEFTTIPADKLDVGVLTGGFAIHVHQPRIFLGDIQIRFIFLFGDNANYVGMAHAYQDYLVNRYNLRRLNVEDDIPMIVDIIGAVNIRKPFLGIPVDRITALTTYDQAIDMLQNFKDEGINNINLKFTGWFNGGVRHTLPMRFNHIRAIGGRAGFQRLLDFTAKNGIRFFPDIGLTFVYADRIFDGFNQRNHASRFITDLVARLEGFNMATLDEEDPTVKHVLSPSIIPRIISSIIKEFGDLNIPGISLRDAGYSVNSDFRKNALIDRQQASNILVDGVKSFKDAGLDILLSGGNANVLPFADVLIDMPMQSNRHDITDHCIPFFQIVISGFVEYAGIAVNSATNPNIELLRAIETGAGIHYRFIYRDNAVLKRTDYDHLFSVNFKDWFDAALKNYRFVNNAVGDVRGERIIDHAIIKPRIHKTTFESGKQVIVNYTRQSFRYEGKTIEGENFVVLREGN